MVLAHQALTDCCSGCLVGFCGLVRGFPSGEPPQDTDGGSSIITLQFIERSAIQASLKMSMGIAPVARCTASSGPRFRGRTQALLESKIWLLADTRANSFQPARQHSRHLARPYSPSTTADGVSQRLSGSTTRFKRDRRCRHVAGHLLFRFYLARACNMRAWARILPLLEPCETCSLGLTTWRNSGHAPIRILERASKLRSADHRRRNCPASPASAP